MRAGCLIAGALLLAGCGPAANNRAADGAAATNDSVAAEASTTTASPRRQIGTVSTLTGSQSSLTGAISGFAVRRTDTKTVATLAADTLFDFDSATIAPAAADNLSRTAALVRDGGPGAVLVIGHTDGKGTDAYNDDLSLRRAQAIADWLKRDPAIAARTLTVEGHGKREPVLPDTLPDDSDNPDGRARNRRVEVIIPR